jgi:excinuclease ABC subunit C
LDTLYDVFSVRGVASDENIGDIKRFLSGESECNAREILTAKMEGASELQQFELAIRYRNGIGFLDKLKERNIANVGRWVNCDVFGAFASADVFVVAVITVRTGKLIGVQNFVNVNDIPLSDGEKIEQFISQYYLENIRPDEVITVADVKIGYKKKLVDMATENAREYLQTSIEKIKHKEQFTAGAVDELTGILRLPVAPKRIECYDISHMGGEDVVGSMVVFVDGAEDKKSYRKFKIRHAGGIDDYKSMCEVITRRLKRTDWGTPDLIVLDGGKGQLSVVLANVETDVPIVAFGGENDDVVLPNGETVSFEKHSYAFRLLQRVRDEAHRFANYFRVQRASKRTK